MLAQRADEAVDPTSLAPPLRSLIFISHASPEDNAFATWLATQLAVAGYAVWCDTTKLLGGEAFWKDITEAIEKHAFRFVFASTLDSNRKAGTLRELKIATDTQKDAEIKDFVVPLKVDAFPFGSSHKDIRDLNFVRFDDSWAAGLKRLLDLLDRERAPKSPLAGPACVAKWHQRSLDKRRQLVVSNEECLTNWFSVRLPRKLRFHRYPGLQSNIGAAAIHMTQPKRTHGDYLVTFSTLAEVNAVMPGGVSFQEGVTVTTEGAIRKGVPELDLAPFDATNIISDLLRQAWELTMEARGMSVHPLASGLTAWYFRNGHLLKNRAHFDTGSRRAYRQLVGHKSKKSADGVRSPDGFWHYAVSASTQLLPFPRLVLRHHVVFSDDGLTPWSSTERMHKARRSVCKNWWNAEWRDRLRAFAAEMSDARGVLALPVSERSAIRVTMAPMSFSSPWTYVEDSASGLDESIDVELIEEQEEDADDDASTS